MIASTFLVLLAPSAVSAPAADPLQPALAGYVQCYEPNEEKKTCRSLASYKRITGARYANTASVLLDPVRPVILETTTPVEVRAGAVCGEIRSEDILDGKLTVAGRSLPKDEAGPVLARIVQSMASIAGKEICTRYVPADGKLLAKASIGGIDRPDADQHVKWVKPADGYSVSP